MSKTILLILFLSSSSWVFGQQLDPSVMASEGGIDSTDQLSLEWTLGEIAIATLSSDAIMITEGFHQPQLIISDYEEPSTTNTTTVNHDYQIRVNPNPVNALLRVQMESTEESVVYVGLYNLEGRQLIKELKKEASDSFEMDLSSLSPGLYLLRFINAEGGLLETFKLSKIN